jgi:hypothetical protein
MKRDYSHEIERLAELHNISPLVVLEWFNERAAIREEGNVGMTRADAERLAITDVARTLNAGGL